MLGNGVYKLGPEKGVDVSALHVNADPGLQRPLLSPTSHTLPCKQDKGIRLLKN